MHPLMHHAVGSYMPVMLALGSEVKQHTKSGEQHATRQTHTCMLQDLPTKLKQQYTVSKALSIPPLQ